MALWRRPQRWCDPWLKWVEHPWPRTFLFFCFHSSLNLWMKLYPEITQTWWWIQLTGFSSSRTDRITLLALLFKEGPRDSWASKHDTSCSALLGSTYWVEFLVGFDGWHMHQGFWGRGMGYLCCGYPSSHWTRRSCFSTTSVNQSFTTLRTNDKLCRDRVAIFIWFKDTDLTLTRPLVTLRVGKPNYF